MENTKFKNITSFFLGRSKGVGRGVGSCCRLVVLLAFFFSNQSIERSCGAESIEGERIGDRMYVKAESWATTLRDSRQQYEKWWRGELDGLSMGPWYLASSHPKQWRQAGEPPGGEQIDFEAKDKNGKPKWQRRDDLIDGVIHYDLSNHGISVQRALPVKAANAKAPSNAEGELCEDPVPTQMKNRSIAIQARVIKSAVARKIKVWVGAQNGIELWLNGKRVYCNPQLGNGLQPKADAAQVELDLKKGDNELVLGLIGVRWEGFYFSAIPRGHIHPDPFFDLIENMKKDFPAQTARLRADVQSELLRAWFRSSDRGDVLKVLADRSDEYLKGTATKPASGERLLGILKSYARSVHYRNAFENLDSINLIALKRTVLDLAKRFGSEYKRSDEFLERIEKYEPRLSNLRRQIDPDDISAGREIAEILEFQRRVLLSNPLLDFEELLVIKRKPLGDPRRAKAPNRGMGEFLGLPQQSSWQLDRIRQPYGWDNEIAVMQMPGDGDASLRTIYRPPTPRLVSDIDLHFDGSRILFSMPGSSDLWQVFEMNSDGSSLRQLSPAQPADVQNFDACYLPSGKIVFISTAPFQGVPCSDGIAVAVAYVMNSDGSNIRQLCFDQDHDYCPTVMNDGRILYLRWDYTDLPHQWPRILFTMNPDGTGQREYYGSGSYWPNAVFYARPIPGHATKIAGIVTGHHVGRVGELVVFDPAEGRHEADGVVQRIPGYGEKVEPIIKDKLTIDCWPKFLHPYPLSEEYFLVSCKPKPDDLWGIYLVDVFDNILLLKEIEDYALFEPIPLRKRKSPPVIADRVQLGREDALLYIENIYKGPGLRGVPKGSVKQLRLFTYYFAYPYKSGGQHRIGTDGPWEPKRILGTVPVEEDGSAFFRVPANTPISMQPLDSEGRALQLMRSWTTAMPGEVVSCIGCHEKQNAVPAGRGATAARRQPSEIQPWNGPARGFDFNREVQPVLDEHCVKCHDGKPRHGQKLVDLRGNQGKYVVFGFNDPRPKVIEGKPKSELVADYAGVFEPSYVALRSLVRVGGLESDLHILNPGEFNADTAELIQMLKKGHHHVQLDDESWRRLYAWIDLNAPCHGNWRQALGLERIAKDHGRRLDLRRLYGGSTDDPELESSDTAEPPTKRKPLHGKKPQDRQEPAPYLARINQAGREPALRKPQYASFSNSTITPKSRTIQLRDGVELQVVHVRHGEFVMGDPKGLADERPAGVVKIEEPFWMGKFEVTNEQYALFDPSHDSRHEHGTASYNSERALGPKLNKPDQPVIRVSWAEAAAFCDWLTGVLNASGKTPFENGGVRVVLPTEAQWEYACRAGTSTDFHFGGLDDDFSRFANVSDATMNGWATYNEKRRSADIVPRDARFDDKALVSAAVGSYEPNPWLLHDMHGNVWEWTRSDYAQYPYDEHDGRNSLKSTLAKTVRGGSWYDRPKRCRSAFRIGYPAWRKVFNVGFRVVLQQQQPDNRKGPRPAMP